MPRVLRALCLALGFGFLYAPILLLVVYSFNASRNVTVWAGFSLQWHRGLWANRELLEAATVSVLLGAATATVATVLGAFSALALVRFGAFRGRTLFGAMAYAPLVMPEMITGLSMLLLFIAAGLERGVVTLFIAHVTFTTCFATVVIQSRLLGFDRSLEEAALDLGCPPGRTFLTVTLPLIAPALAAAWMIAFAISFDDLIISQFTTGPGARTLPMVVYSEARRGVRPEINAVSSILIAIVGTLVVSASLLAKRRAGFFGRD